MKSELYCKLFIHTKMSIEELFDLVNQHLKGTKTGIRTIRTNLLEFDLRNNNEYCPSSQDFVFWKYYADVETWVSDKINYIQCLNSLILFLKNNHIDTIAACNFENELFTLYTKDSSFCCKKYF